MEKEKKDEPIILMHCWYVFIMQKVEMKEKMQMKLKYYFIKRKRKNYT